MWTGLAVLAAAVVVAASVLAPTAIRVSGAGPTAQPYDLTATWCAKAQVNPHCVGSYDNRTSEWTVLITWSLTNGSSPSRYILYANQSTGTPSVAGTASPARWVDFQGNATNAVVLGTNLRGGWGLNPTQNWIFALCSVNATESCASWWEFPAVTTLAALDPTGIISAPTNLSARWVGGCLGACLRVSWSYEQGWLTANFFRVGLLNGTICLQPPTLGDWNHSGWRKHTTANESEPSNSTSYEFRNLPLFLVHRTVCAYVEAVNRSIGDGLHGWYPHGLPAHDAVILPGPLCPKCTIPSRLR